MAESREETVAVWAVEIHERATRSEHLELLRLAKTEYTAHKKAVQIVLVHVVYKVQSGSALSAMSKPLRLASVDEVEREHKMWISNLKPYQDAFKMLNIKAGSHVERSDKRHTGLCQSVVALGASRLYMFGFKPHFGSVDKEVTLVDQILPSFCSLAFLQNRKRLHLKEATTTAPAPLVRPQAPLSRSSSATSSPATSGRLPVSNNTLNWLASGPESSASPPTSTHFPVQPQGEAEGRIQYPTIDVWQYPTRTESESSLGGGSREGNMSANGSIGGYDPYTSNGVGGGGSSRSTADLSSADRKGPGEGSGVQREGSNGVSHHSESWPVKGCESEVPLGGDGVGAEDRGILETRLRTLTLEAELARVHALLASNEREAERQQALREARRAKEENQRLIREAEERERRMLATGVKEFSGAEVAAGCNGFAPDLQIGAGGFAGVWCGMLDFVPVAVKKLNDAPAATEALQKEVKLQAGLNHPHVLRLFGFCSTPPCLITEYMEEGSLDTHLSGHKMKAPLPWSLRFEIFDEVCQGVAALHARQPPLIHSDLKPANILLDKNFRAKVGDVGIANLLDNLTPGVSYMDLSVAMGTLDYAAPELALQRQSSCKADVYSLGIVLLDLLRGIQGEKMAFVEQVEEALEEMEKGEGSGMVQLMSLLDKSAGEWPQEVAHKLAELAVACCRLERRKRMASVEKMLETLAGMRELVKTEAQQQKERRKEKRVAEDERNYCCPITHEMMKDPVMAADGHTYERFAITNWLTTNDRSPLTNEALKHKDLVTNISLRYVIEEWNEKQRKKAMG